MNDTSTTAEEITSNSLDTVDDDEMALSEHIEEFSQRLIFCIICSWCCNFNLFCRC